MCNDYEQHVTWAAYCKVMQALELGIRHNKRLDLPQADDTGSMTWVQDAYGGNGVELVR